MEKKTENFDVKSIKKAITKRKNYGKSKRQILADKLREENAGYSMGMWNPFNMSNRQVILKFRPPMKRRR